MNRASGWPQVWKLLALCRAQMRFYFSFCRRSHRFTGLLCSGVPRPLSSSQGHTGGHKSVHHEVQVCRHSLPYSPSCGSTAPPAPAAGNLIILFLCPIPTPYPSYVRHSPPSLLIPPYPTLQLSIQKQPRSVLLLSFAFGDPFLLPVQVLDTSFCL